MSAKQKAHNKILKHLKNKEIFSIYKDFNYLIDGKMETSRMDIPKIKSSYISKDSPVSKTFESNNKNANGHSFKQNEEEAPTEHQDDFSDILLKSFNKHSETFVASTNEWLVTWRPLI